MADSPTADELAGMAWWNGLSEADRLLWCRLALTAVPAEAWQYWKRAMAPDSHDLAALPGTAENRPTSSS